MLSKQYKTDEENQSSTHNSTANEGTKQGHYITASWAAYWTTLGDTSQKESKRDRETQQQMLSWKGTQKTTTTTLRSPSLSNNDENKHKRKNNIGKVLSTGLELAPFVHSFLSNTYWECTIYQVQKDTAMNKTDKSLPSWALYSGRKEVWN